MTKFSDMTDNAREGWFLWAREHDWGRDARFEGDELANLLDHSVDREGVSRYSRIRFDNPRAMKIWAGY